MGIEIVTKLDCTYTCDRCGQKVEREHLADKGGPGPLLPTGWAWMFASKFQGGMPWKRDEGGGDERWSFYQMPVQSGDLRMLCAACSEEFTKKGQPLNVGPTRQAVTELAEIEAALRAYHCHHSGEPDPDCLLCDFRRILKIG